MFADGLAGGSGQVLDGKEGQAALLLKEEQDLDAPVVGGPLQDPFHLPSERCVHIGLDFDFWKRMRSKIRKHWPPQTCPRPSGNAAPQGVVMSLTRQLSMECGNVG